VFCKSCGHEIDIDSKYCSFCGARQPELNKPQEIQKPEESAHPINKIVESSSALIKPMVEPPNLETKTNNKSVSSENLLDDIDNIHKSLHRPNSVNISIFLQVAVIIYRLVYLVLGMIANSIGGIEASGILGFSIWFGSLANSIFFRKKRARITYCILISFGIAISVFFVRFDLQRSWTLSVERLCIIGVNFTAAILLFTKSASKWFNADKENIFSADQKSTIESP
jgi:hypothetical protein